MASLIQVFRSAIAGREKTLSPASSRGGWWPIVRESFTGAWQRNITVNRESVLSNHAVFACQTLIASDIAKLRIKLVAKSSDGIWQETASPAYSPVLRKPNGYQTRIQFIEAWVISKLQHGNAVILKRRDNRNVVVELHVLDWTLVTPLISDGGEVFYELRTDNLAGVTERLIVPASEVIHDRYNCLFHPLIGLSPIYANGLAATQGLAIQNNSTKFFENNSQPGGILTAPGVIKDETAQRLKTYWEQNYSGDNAGKVAVLGDGLKYEAMAVKAVDAQLIEQLKWTAEVICSTYHVPGFMIGVGGEPSYNNAEIRAIQYYNQSLQRLIEDIELCLDEGLATGETLGTEFDTDGLWRMDTATLMESIKSAVSAGAMSPNEARKKLDLGPVEGGESPYLQQQNYSLAALAKRDAQADPFGKEAPALPAPEPENDNLDDDTKALIAGAEFRKALFEANAGAA